MTTIQRILFLCTGNYYRSRYAEELFNHIARAEGLGWRAFSCGAADQAFPENVGPMSEQARGALAAKGIVPEGGLRDPRSCSLSDFDEAQRVVALKEAEHRPLIEQRFPGVANRVIYWHIDDIEFVHPSIALAQIDSHVSELISTLKQPVWELEKSGNPATSHRAKEMFRKSEFSKLALDIPFETARLIAMPLMSMPLTLAASQNKTPVR